MAENRTYDELTLGQSASIERVVTSNDLWVFARASGNFNPIHRPDYDIDNDGASDAVAPSMWLGALFSAVLGNVLPGPGTFYLGQSLRFHDRARVGDRLTVEVTVREKRPDNRVVLETRVSCGDRLLCDGEAEVVAPAEKIVFSGPEIPELIVETHVQIDALIDRCAGLAALPTAVVVPEEEHSLGGALLAADHGLIAPILVGDPARIRQAAEALRRPVDLFEVVEALTGEEAAARAVALVHEGRAAAVMKGHLHTEELLRHVVKTDGGLRIGRRLSHVFVTDVPGRPELLLITDAAINIVPDLKDKTDIVQNAIDLALALGIEEPRVAVLSALETVSARIQSTLDAAALSKMAERGQIRGGLVDGPLAMDNALSAAAARTKGIGGPVAGRANILVAPNLEAGNMLAKELSYAAHAETAGLVVGARVPIMLSSRADDDRARLASCAVAVLYRAWLEKAGADLH